MSATSAPERGTGFQPVSETLPPGWTMTTLGDVCALNPKLPVKPEPESPVTFVPMAAVCEYTGAIITPQSKPFSAVSKGYTPFIEGDVIWAKITPCMENGKAAIARNLINGVGVGSTEFFVLRSKGSVLPEYLHRFVRQENFRAAAQKTMNSAVGQARVPKDFLLSAPIPLPPLAEQRRIVARLEALMARSRRARALLAEVPAQMAQARQSLLASAFRGDLTAEWREANSASEWRSGQLKDFVQIRYGKGMPVSDLLEAGYPVFGANGVIGFTDTFHFEHSQVLISCRGAYSGKINWSPPHCFVTNNSLSVIPKNAEQILSRWLYFALCGSDTSRMVTGTAQPQVTIANAEVLEVAVPSIAEQHEIVRRLNTAFARLDATAAAHATAVAELDRLDQSLLARAFSGAL